MAQENIGQFVELKLERVFTVTGYRVYESPRKGQFASLVSNLGVYFTETGQFKSGEIKAMGVLLGAYIQLMRLITTESAALTTTGLSFTHLLDKPSQAILDQITIVGSGFSSAGPVIRSLGWFPWVEKSVYRELVIASTIELAHDIATLTPGEVKGALDTTARQIKGNIESVEKAIEQGKQQRS